MHAVVRSIELGDLAGPSCLDPERATEDLRAFGESLPAHDGRRLFQHWLARWSNGRPPDRADILPEELGRLLSCTFLIEIEPDARLRYRLIGSELASGLGHDWSGRHLDEVRAGFPEPLVRRAIRRDTLSVGQARPLLSGCTLEHVGRAWRSLVSLRLPLLQEGRVSHLLGWATVD